MRVLRYTSVITQRLVFFRRRIGEIYRALEDVGLSLRQQAHGSGNRSNPFRVGHLDDRPTTKGNKFLSSNSPVELLVNSQDVGLLIRHRKLGLVGLTKFFGLHAAADR